MSEEQLLATFQSAIRDVLNNPKLTVTAENSLFEDLGLESIDLLDLSSDLEKTLGRELDFKGIFKAVTAKKGISTQEVSVGDVVQYLSQN
jgi:acyl carrier protein